MASSGANAAGIGETRVPTRPTRPTGRVAAAQAARRARRYGTLVRRCAWCARYELGSHWFGQEEVPEGFRERVAKWTTDGICEDCLEQLKAARRDGFARSSLSARP